MVMNSRGEFCRRRWLPILLVVVVVVVAAVRTGDTHDDLTRLTCSWIQTIPRIAHFLYHQRYSSLPNGFVLSLHHTRHDNSMARQRPTSSFVAESVLKVSTLYDWCCQSMNRIWCLKGAAL